MSLIRLKFRGVSEIVGSEQMGLLVLTDMAETRQLSIVCDQTMVRQFGLRLEHPRQASRLLPEVLWQAFSRRGDTDYQLIITNLYEGQYQALLFHPDRMQSIPMRASDAVLLAYISGLPLLIEEGLMRRQSVAFHGDKPGVAIPVNVISNDMLQRALDKAVATENYEQASQLRDELNRRKGHGG